MKTIHGHTPSRYIAAVLAMVAAFLYGPTITVATVAPDRHPVIEDSAIDTESSLMTPDIDPCLRVEHILAWNGVTSRSCDTSRN